MADRAVTGVGIGGQEQVTFFDGAVVSLFEAMNKAFDIWSAMLETAQHANGTEFADIISDGLEGRIWVTYELLKHLIMSSYQARIY